MAGTERTGQVREPEVASAQRGELGRVIHDDEFSVVELHMEGRPRVLDALLPRHRLHNRAGLVLGAHRGHHAGALPHRLDVGTQHAQAAHRELHPRHQRGVQGSG